MTANATITYPAVTGTLSTLAGTETLTNKTITSGAIVTPVITLTANAATANGSAQAAAGALAVSAVNTATGDGTAGVVLPAAAAGKMVIVYNLHANLGLKVYPAVGDDINDGATDAAVTIEGKTMAIFVALDDTTWAAIYTANT